MKTTKRMFSKVIALLLCLIMASPISITNVQAAEVGTRAADAGLVVDKTATLEDDGTYTFQLEAFATGETVTITSTDPTDVVLVLDVSGSMEDDYSYVTGQDWQFADDYVRNKPTDVYHKCLDGTYSTVTWTQEGTLSSTYRYTCDNCKATRKWSTPLWNKIPGEGSDDPWNLYRYTDITVTKQKMLAMQEAAIAFVNGVAEKNAELTDVNQQHRVSIVKFADEVIKTNVGNEFDGDGYNYTQVVTAMTEVTEDTKDSIIADINSLTPSGATAADKGLEVAEEVLASSATGRQKVVILLTDGDPNHANGFDNTVASTAVTTAENMKENGVTIYTVGLVTGADPDDVTTDFNKYLNAVSSNYPDATVTNTSNFTVDLKTGGNYGYYKETAQSGSLTDIFKEIQESIGTSTVTLDESAMLKDVIVEGFVLPNSFNESNITVQTVDYSGRDRNGNRVFATTGVTLTTAVKDYDKATNTITVTGFDYADNCLIDGTSHDSNDFTAAVQGKKLVVTITGVEATDALITNEALNTNKMASGVYSDVSESQLAAEFPIPQTIFTRKSYVLDYAKPITVTASDWGHDTSLIKVKNDMAVATTKLTGVYGDITLSDSNLTFAPMTTNWSNYDSVYALGKTTNTEVTSVSANGNGNVWTKVSFIPANNVYYEDDFITAENGVVGIEYTGNWTVVSDVNNAETNTEIANTEVHGGWKNTTLANDATYSDGSAHELKTGATATFTFTGTGVDIYSRTNAATGVINAELYVGTDATITKNMSQAYIIDNIAESGDYYQIPTASFKNLDYGTYTVKIEVYSTGTGDAARTTYYLDGIRVYNPILEDETVAEAYGDETGAYFTEVRDILLIAEDFDATTETADGVVFIDKITDEAGNTTNDIGTYYKYGPKNEVYLEKDQAIAFNVTNYMGGKLSVGIKAPEGTTTAQVTNSVDTSPLTIATASDLYYEITPNENGLVIIKNTGDNLLSITKLKMSGEMEVGGVSVMSLRAYADEFDTLAVVDYEQEAEEIPEGGEGDTGADDNTGDVEIETPEENENQTMKEIQKWIKNIINSFRNWFK